MNASVYTSLFNYSPDKFDLLGAFKNWSKYADEIVVATFEDQRNKIEEEVAYVLEYDCIGENCLSKLWNKINVVSCPETSLEDPLFDGKLKNAALQACSNELVIQQDMDERLSGEIEQWELLARMLYNYNHPITCMIPVIDLYKDLDHYKGINHKWYFHRKEGVHRGPVNFAKRKNGTLDINKSDSCEAVDQNGDLVPYFADNRFLDNLDIRLPHVAHLGFLDLEKRAENNKFWKPHWENRCQEHVDIATSIEELESENEAIPHNLPREWWT